MGLKQICDVMQAKIRVDTAYCELDKVLAVGKLYMSMSNSTKEQIEQGSEDMVNKINEALADTIKSLETCCNSTRNVEKEYLDM